MKSTYLTRVVSSEELAQNGVRRGTVPGPLGGARRTLCALMVLASAAATAQVARQGDAVPLKNWATPLLWQPNQAERDTAAKAAPQLVFSANAVSADALTFVAITPCRLVDTRGAAAGFNGIPPFSGPSIPAGGTLTIPVQSAIEATIDTAPAPCGLIPTIAQAYSFNLTVVPRSAGPVDYVSLWPSGAAQPFVATLNDPQGAIVSNAAIVPAGSPSGGVSVFNNGPATADVIIDMNGYFAAPTDVNSNTAIGAGSLASNTSGIFNTATGAGALNSNTAGNDNTANGYQALQSNTGGSFNTASGFYALQNNTNGGNNTASGNSALRANTSGNFNTASGEEALFNNTTGSQNTASGGAALQSNTTGNNNTASGYQALYANTTGNGNIADGYQALQDNTTGGSNTASGYQALQDNTTGGSNTAIGAQALESNTTGVNNSAIGASALQANNTGGGNTASGYSALQQNTTGSENTADGWGALNANTTGGYNVAVGWGALNANTTGANNIAIGMYAASTVAAANGDNIHIGNQGLPGDAATIRIGTVGTQTSTYIAGIDTASVSSGVAVYVTASGQLGTVLSSRRFKDQITDMGDSSSKLLQLRPVNFFYKPQYDDGSHTLQYGLIAEEVAKVYPEMVAYDKDGQILTVKYQMLAPMLLNEVQKQNGQLQSQLQLQQEENRKLEDRLAALEALLAGQTATAARPESDQ